MPPFNFGFSFLNALLNFIYPAVCAYCNTRLQAEEKLFCTKCWRSVQIVESSTPEELTAVKVWGSLPLEKIKSLWWFDDFVQALIHEMKYNRKLSLTKKLGVDLARIILQDGDFANADLLIPVPLHKSKQRERGYNQSLLLAKSIARHTKIPIENKIIKRIQKTRTQAKLNAEQRMQNVSSAFEVTDVAGVNNKKVILIDDVCTTGATLFACADVLLTAGCSRVLAVTVAKAPGFEQAASV
jgi:ComF family protein